MANRMKEFTITDSGNPGGPNDTQFGTSRDIEAPPGANMVNVKLAGTFDGATLTLTYQQVDGTVKPFNSADAAKTADGEISAFIGEGDVIGIRDASGSGSVSVIAVVTYSMGR